MILYLQLILAHGGLVSLSPYLEPIDAVSSPDIADFPVSLLNQILHCLFGRVKVIDQDTAEIHAVLPVIQYDHRTSGVAERVQFPSHHLSTQDDRSRLTVLDQILHLVFIIRIPFIQVAQHHLITALAAFLLKTADQGREKGGIVNNGTIFLKGHQLDFGNGIFVYISHFLCHPEYLGRCLGIDALFMVQGIGHSGR